MELMSPAGNIRLFLAAIESGADSVYLGLKKFNARMPADNFSSYQLKKAVKYAHQKNKKVYLALNIDLKSGDLKEAAEMLSFASAEGLDGIIVKDPSLIYIAGKFFKDAPLHYSTQNAISNSFGVKFARSQNAFRVVLAREMTLDEIKKACMTENVECEIFTEGSMCFSISGKCLMSSWAGGKSGNRGLCAAPCRVLWDNKKSKSPFFAMKDLSLFRYIDELKKINVKALKIEGRLKSPLWVRDITKLYRKAVDNPGSIKALSDEFDGLKKYSAREIKEGHILRHDGLTGGNEDWVKYDKTETFIINEPYFIEKNEIKIKCDKQSGLLKAVICIFEKEHDLEIKLVPDPKKARLKPLQYITAFFNQNDIRDNGIEFVFDDPSFPLSSSFMQKTAAFISDELRKIINNEEKMPELTFEIADFIKPKTDTVKRNKNLGERPDKIIIGHEFIDGLYEADVSVKTVVVPLMMNENIESLKKIREKYSLVLSIPSVLYEDQAVRINEYVKSLVNNGFVLFEANSYTGIEILNGLNCGKFLGPDMPVLNYLAAEYFYKLGFKSVYGSNEPDISSLKALSKFTDGSIEMLVFARLPLFYSRVDSPDFTDRQVFTDRYNTAIQCVKENDLNLFVCQTPLSFVSNKILNENVYFDSLTADLRYFSRPLKILDDLCSGSINYETSVFNLMRKFP